jgi:hypothetical protein
MPCKRIELRCVALCLFSTYISLHISKLISFFLFDCMQVSNYPKWREQRSFMLAVNKPTAIRLIEMHKELLLKQDMVCANEI